MGSRYQKIPLLPLLISLFTQHLKVNSHFFRYIAQKLTHVFFSDMRVFLNNTSVSGASSHYNYKCYLETLTNYAPTLRNTAFQAAGWYPDAAGEFNSTSGQGFIDRMDLFSTVDAKTPNGVNAEGENVEEGVRADPLPKPDRTWSGNSEYFIGPLFCDLDALPIYNGVKVKIELRKAKDGFFLMGSQTGAKFQLEEVILHVPVGILHPKLAIHLETRLKETNMRLNFRRRNLIPFQVPKASTSFYSDSKYTIPYLFPSHKTAFFRRSGGRRVPVAIIVYASLKYFPRALYD